ncbi:unnamed protein product [Allacma fusca]|uniref:Aldehyde dehydrogenase domain-containing protein n=1 Tax=Allacma fusca TaxID=39272 RepID=A0A8J2JV16_9HEXA|nr:unnamed protein product [Allacma fusca]
MHIINVEPSPNDSVAVQMETSNQFPEITAAREAFSSGKTLPIEFRRRQLSNLQKMLHDEKSCEKIYTALHKDMRKSRFESFVSEVCFVRHEVQFQLMNLKKFTSPEKLSRNFLTLTNSAQIRSEPHGLTLELFRRFLDNNCYHVFLGDVERTKALLTNRFDYIFFTGSTNVGRIIMQTAAKHLTPVTLELGGKSPVYIHESGCIRRTVKRIIFAKCHNMGQVCVGADFLICTKRNDSLMEDEIFGPILPIVTVSSADEAIHFLRSLERPLALYIFSRNKKITQRVLDSVPSGGVMVNELLLHISDLRVPFGGTGMSGMGRYHGKYSFDTFSHKRAVVTSGLSYLSEKFIDPRYPPATSFNFAIANFYYSAMNYFPLRFQIT